MNKNTLIIVGVVVLLLILGGVFASMKNKDDSMMQKDLMEQKAMEEKSMAEGEETMEDKSTTETNGGNSINNGDLMMKLGSYESYSEEKIAMAETGDVVLFFHASWCPSCRGLNADIEKNLKSIPQGLTILKTDYDKETELKKKYGVTYQHTLVQVDKDGNMIHKWSGGAKLADLLAQIK